MHAQLLPLLWLITTQVSPGGGATGGAVREFVAPAERNGLRRVASETVQLQTPPRAEKIVTEWGAPVVSRPKSATDKPSPAFPAGESSGGSRFPVHTDRDAASEAAAEPAEPAAEPAGAEDALDPPNGTSGSLSAAANNPLRDIAQAANQELYGRRELAADRTAAPALLKHALSAPRDESLELPGEPLTLQAALDRAGDRAPRLNVVRAYWRLTTDVAKYYWSVEEHEFLAELPSSQQAGESTLLVAAQGDAQAQLQQAKVTAVMTQSDLGELVRVSSRESAPLPYDPPLLGAYQTKFDRIFANRSPPAGLRRIALAIPLQNELIELRAAAVAAATESVKELNHEYRQGQTPLTTLLSAQMRLRRLRGEFLDSIRAYNEWIAEYALTIGGTGNSQTIVAMLIKSPAPTRTAQAPAQRSFPATPSDASAFGAPRISRDPATTPASRPGTWMAPRTTVREGAPRATVGSDPRYSPANDATPNDANIRPTLPSDGQFGGESVAPPPTTGSQPRSSWR